MIISQDDSRICSRTRSSILSRVPECMSRTDGGSGIGLSIAQSFTEACGGEFSWETDADLFVVKVSF